MFVKSEVEYLSEYAAYHRDRRNIAIHSVGIPLIVFAVVILTSRPIVHLGFVDVRPALVLLIALEIFYFILDPVLGFAFTLAGLFMGYVALLISGEPTIVWLATGISAFVVGWILQLIGHGWEGKKPAFLDDIMGLAVGPLFVTAEAFFAAGQKKELKEAIEARVGPPRSTRVSAPRG